MYYQSQHTTLPHLNSSSSRITPRISKRPRQSQSRLIIGIDYGTSYSGAAYTLYVNRNAQPYVETIGDWPHRIPYHRSIEKVPSDIAYDAEGRAHCGFDIPDGLTRLQWVKLLLETDLDPDKERLRNAVEVQSTLQTLKELDKTPVEVSGDYLKWLWTNIKQKICESQSDPHLLENSAVTVVMTVPAMWSDKARDNTVRAAEIAGISGEGRNLKFLNEPEAAAISELKKRVATGQIEEEDCVIVCDAGGGTVDLVSYQVKQKEPLKLDQKVIAQGDLCGSVFIEHEFQRQLTGLLQGDMEKLSEKAVAEIAQRFEYVIKPSYEESDTAEYYMAVPGLEDNEERQIKNGSLRINSEIVRTSFESVMAQILCLIDDQYSGLKKVNCEANLKGILLVGGLGESKFVHSRICQDYPPDEGIRVWRGERSWTSVVKGAVHCEYMELGNTHLINTRLSRWNYGIPFRETYDPMKHREEDRYHDPHWKSEKARNQVCWLVKKGQMVNPDTEPETHEFCIVIKDSDFHSNGNCVLLVDLVRSGEDCALNHRTKEVRNFATINCTVGKEILDGAIVSKLELDEPAWTVRIFIELIMQPALLSFRCLVSGKAVGTTTASYRDIQESDQTLTAGGGSTNHSTAASSREVDAASQKSSRDGEPSRPATPASDTSAENGTSQPFTRDVAARDTNRRSVGARHGRMIHLGTPASTSPTIDPIISRPAPMDSRRGLLLPTDPTEHNSSRSTECSASGTWYNSLSTVGSASRT